MKKVLSIILALVLCLGMFAGCKTRTENVEKNIINPLPETLDIKALDNCTVAVSLEEAYVDGEENVMKIKAYSYELYDMVDIASLKVDDAIVRRGEEIKIAELDRLDTGLVRINGGEENGGFDLISKDNTVYYQVGMNDAKSYYELGEVVLPVSDAFEYVDESDLDSEAKHYSFEELVVDDAKVEYNFVPNNTSVVIENGVITKMTRTYMP